MTWCKILLILSLLENIFAKPTDSIAQVIRDNILPSRYYEYQNLRSNLASLPLITRRRRNQRMVIPNSIKKRLLRNGITNTVTSIKKRRRRSLNQADYVHDSNLCKEYNDNLLRLWTTLTKYVGDDVETPDKDTLHNIALMITAYLKHQTPRKPEHIDPVLTKFQEPNDENNLNLLTPMIEQIKTLLKKNRNQKPVHVGRILDIMFDHLHPYLIHPINELCKETNVENLIISVNSAYQKYLKNAECQGDHYDDELRLDNSTGILSDFIKKIDQKKEYIPKLLQGINKIQDRKNLESNNVAQLLNINNNQSEILLRIINSDIKEQPDTLKLLYRKTHNHPATASAKALTDYLKYFLGSNQAAEKYLSSTKQDTANEYIKELAKKVEFILFSNRPNARTKRFLYRNKSLKALQNLLRDILTLNRFKNVERKHIRNTDDITELNLTDDFHPEEIKLTGENYVSYKETNDDPKYPKEYIAYNIPRSQILKQTNNNLFQELAAFFEKQKVKQPMLTDSVQDYCEKFAFDKFHEAITNITNRYILSSECNGDEAMKSVWPSSEEPSQLKTDNDNDENSKIPNLLNVLIAPSTSSDENSHNEFKNNFLAKLPIDTEIFDLNSNFNNNDFKDLVILHKILSELDRRKGEYVGIKKAPIAKQLTFSKSSSIDKELLKFINQLKNPTVAETNTYFQNKLTDGLMIKPKLQAKEGETTERENGITNDLPNMNPFQIDIEARNNRLKTNLLHNTESERDIYKIFILQELLNVIKYKNKLIRSLQSNFDFNLRSLSINKTYFDSSRNIKSEPEKLEKESNILLETDLHGTLRSDNPLHSIVQLKDVRQIEFPFINKEQNKDVDVEITYLLRNPNVVLYQPQTIIKHRIPYEYYLKNKNRIFNDRTLSTDDHIQILKVVKLQSDDTSSLLYQSSKQNGATEFYDASTVGKNLVENIVGISGHQTEYVNKDKEIVTENILFGLFNELDEVNAAKSEIKENAPENIFLAENITDSNKTSSFLQKIFADSKIHQQSNESHPNHMGEQTLESQEHFLYNNNEKVSNFTHPDNSMQNETTTSEARDSVMTNKKGEIIWNNYPFKSSKYGMKSHRLQKVYKYNTTQFNNILRAYNSIQGITKNPE